MIDVVLPCLDEVAALPWVITRMPDGYRPIVADNGSTDGSAEVAVAHGALVVHEPQRGFGAACHAGLLAATSEIVCFMDADASLAPVQLPDVVALLAGADLALGRRRPDPALLLGVPMSRPDTGACQLDRLRGLHVRTLPTLTDVDTAADAAHVAARAPGTHFAAALRAIETGHADDGSARRSPGWADGERAGT